MRTFFAIDLPDDVTRTLEERCATVAGRSDLSDARWTPTSNIHLTLRFLGETPGPVLDRVHTLVSKALIQCPPCCVSFDRIQFFPSSRRARVVAVAIRPSLELVHVATVLEHAVREAGLSPEVRRFRPHVTLARLRLDRRERAQMSVDTPRLDFTVDEILLLKSTLLPAGARYDRFHTYKLASCSRAGAPL